MFDAFRDNRRLQVDCRWDDVLSYCECRQDSLDSSCSTKHMAGSSLRRCHNRLTAAQESLDCLELHFVAHWSGCPMSIDIVDVFGFQTRLLHGCLHSSTSTLSTRCGHMV